MLHREEAARGLTFDCCEHQVRDEGAMHIREYLSLPKHQVSIHSLLLRGEVHLDRVRLPLSKPTDVPSPSSVHNRGEGVQFLHIPKTPNPI